MQKESGSGAAALLSVLLGDDRRCIIVGAGDCDGELPARAAGDLIIACDAGLRHLEQRGIRPDLILGDFDSAAADPALSARIEAAERQDPARVLRLPVAKDDTDTLRAAREGLARGFRRFLFYGALGGARLDHTLANIQTLLFLKHNGGAGVLAARDQLLFVIENEAVAFPRGMTGGLSVFALGERAEGVTIAGAAYEMTDGTITSDFPIGVSNAFIKNRAASVAVKNGALLVVLRRENSVSAP